MFHSFSMAKRPGNLLKQRRRNFLREWRKYRNDMTQETLAERTKMSVGNISQFERGLQGHSDDSLEAWADALQCEPWHILNVNPLDDDSVWSLWERALPAEQQIVKETLKAFVGKRKSG
jgi:transcriptional regulator with XRE-family HTH domain